MKRLKSFINSLNIICAYLILIPTVAVSIIMMIIVAIIITPVFFLKIPKLTHATNMFYYVYCKVIGDSLYGFRLWLGLKPIKRR